MMRNRNAQTAMVDAILFMTVMLVASALVIGTTGSGRPAHSEIAGLQQYTRDFARAILAVELSGMAYTDSQGKEVQLENTGRSIGQLLCDEALLLEGSQAPQDFTGYESRILAVGNTMVRPGMDFAVSCDGTPVFISGMVSDASGLPDDRFASRTVIFSDQHPGSFISITVYLWVV